MALLKTLLILPFSLVLFVGSAQQIQFAPITNLDIMIANIFGVQCDGVSNVQLFSAPIQVGRFENGNTIGLNSGLMMSTGLTTGTNLGSWNFNSTGIGSAGDGDIAMFGANAGQNPSNYDACRIEFDFSPSVSDTIRFTYVLASEEYPEYSNSGYTDRFLFLVSENGGAYGNIAFLPGTTIPVEINSVNQFVNSQYYIDNTSGVNSPYFVFDGYTVPFEAKFFAEVGSTYHIKLVLADVNDAIYDSAIFLDEQESFNDISGQLTVNGSPAEGILDVFNFVGDTLLATPVQSLIVTNGNYLADSLQTGMYHVRFTPDPALFPGVAPLYYTAGDTWSDAEAIGLPCFLDNGNINSTSVNASNGSGTISGNIVIDTTYLLMPTQPFENALVKLFNVQDEVVGFTYTDSEGNFSFVGLGSGDYYILMDVPYIPQLNVHSITVIDGQNIVGADFTVMTEGITAANNLALSLSENSLSKVSIYPNPAKDLINITNFSGAVSAFEIFNIQGHSVLKGELNSGTQAVNTSDLSNGIYIVEVAGSDRIRLVIAK
jgi:hypothetical protein